MVIVASVTSLWSESGSTATPDHLSGIPPSWPGSHREPSFGRWPTAPLQGCMVPTSDLKNGHSGTNQDQEL
jgi:hypothetical protein